MTPANADEGRQVKWPPRKANKIEPGSSGPDIAVQSTYPKEMETYKGLIHNLPNLKAAKMPLQGERINCDVYKQWAIVC